MKIKKLKLISFGKFEKKEIELQDGLNIIYGKNEAGKSTISAFIRFMLYSFPKDKLSKNNPVPEKDKFIPWNGGILEGALEVEDEGKPVTITRTQKKTSVVKVINSITGEELREFSGAEPGVLLLDADAETFERTAFIRQNELEVSTSSELESRLRNLVSGGEEDLSYNDGKARLESALRKIDRPNAGMLAQVQREIFALEEKLSLSRGQFEKWREAEQELSKKTLEKEELEREISLLQARYDGQMGFLASQRLEKIKECEVSLLEYRERLQKIESELDRNGAIPDESFIKEVRRLSQDLRIYAEKVRLCKEDVKAAKIRIDNKQSELSQYDKILGSEDKIADSIKKASKTKNMVLPFIGSLMLVAMVLSFMGAFLGISFNLAMFIIGCVFGIAGLVLMIIYWSKRGKARADRIASAYGNYSAEELLAKIELIKSLQSELVFLNSEYERHLEREKKEEETKNEIQNQLDRLGEVRGISPMTLSAAELMCNEIESLLSRRQTATSNIKLFESKRTALLEGITIKELTEQAANAVSENEEIPVSELLASINTAKEKLKELSLSIQTLHYKQKDLLKSSDTPDGIMTEILALKEKKNRISANRQALEKALNALNKAYEHISMVFAPKLCSEAGELFNSIADKGRELFIDSANNVKIGEDGRIKELQYFSTGTRDATYISVRLAICKLIFDKKSTPVIFDDTFAHFDLDRLQNAVDLLKELSKHTQIILFTCREEEKRLCSDFANLIEI